ncbi:flavodoxin family protein [Alkalicella caledoniensis]|uniref:Flavodoxin family protein n=1 Tax=Alkalicella caledoniensis TaxID=2731377 RepID=A0A7G9W6L2_ALKCA|nr:flavodoxin family protein [Alkalicella caledoniensis]QNO14324.1 flavodoxin family protein [Alkalicella caledoniensis]
MSRKESKVTDSLTIKCLIVVYSYHHNNTAKIAQVFSEVLNAQIKTPDQVTQEDLQQYNLIGFGAGIDSGKHYKPLLDFVDKLSKVNNQKGFIFSTSAIQGVAKVKKDHSLLKEKLISKGYIIVDEFSCKGFNTNSFLKYFGGMNKGRPNSEDLEHAEKFAVSLLHKVSCST